MSIVSEIRYEQDNNYCQKLKDEYISEMKDILSDCEIEWNENYLNPRDYSPEFDFGYEDNSRWFYIVLGKYIAITDYQKNLNL